LGGPGTPLGYAPVNAKVSRREPSAMSSAVGLYGLGETNEASEQLDDFRLEHQLALANTILKQNLLLFIQPRWQLSITQLNSTQQRTTDAGV